MTGCSLQKVSNFGDDEVLMGQRGGEKEKEVKKEKKGKKDKSKDAEEAKQRDLDQILAELETPGSKKKGKKGKN
eukprot:Skav229518  [mRNA]  locus=scaffold887:44178:45124:+ [translate_table: standard]